MIIGLVNSIISVRLLRYQAVGLPLCKSIAFIMAISLTIDGKEAALKKGSSIEYVSENRIFTDADDYTMEIELPLAGCAQNMAIFGMLTRKDVDVDNIFFDAASENSNKYGFCIKYSCSENQVFLVFSRLLAFFTRLALILDKLGCVSEIKMKNFAFHFVFLSTCTNFAS